MPATLPSQRTWVLRFKNHRSTFLLHVDPLQKLAHVRTELLKAITETNPEGTLNGVTIPQNPDDIQLARPVDHNDLKLGWESIDRSNDLTGDENTSGFSKGKGKASLTNTTPQTKKGDVLDSPQGAGLRDHGIVAFKFRVPADITEDGVEGAVDEDKAILAGLSEQWDVKIPTIAETYGEGENEMDAIPERSDLP